MKTLYLLRHAKADGNVDGITDFERPLTIRGRMDATGLARNMLAQKFNPEIIISSPATRALFTARLVAEGIRYPARRIKVDEWIYEAWIEQLMDVIGGIADQIESAMVVGHNPGLQLLAVHLSDFKEDKFPTCSFLVLELPTNSWSQISRNSGRIRHFSYPKK
jgi:phosphohistidine phosphatase